MTDQFSQPGITLTSDGVDCHSGIDGGWEGRWDSVAQAFSSLKCLHAWYNPPLTFAQHPVPLDSGLVLYQVEGPFSVPKRVRCGWLEVQAYNGPGRAGGCIHHPKMNSCLDFHLHSPALRSGSNKRSTKQLV